MKGPCDWCGSRGEEFLQWAAVITQVDLLLWRGCIWGNFLRVSCLTFCSWGHRTGKRPGAPDSCLHKARLVRSELPQEHIPDPGTHQVPLSISQLIILVWLQEPVATISLISEMTPNSRQCTNRRHGLEDGLRIWGSAWWGLWSSERDRWALHVGWRNRGLAGTYFAFFKFCFRQNKQ